MMDLNFKAKDGLLTPMTRVAWWKTYTNYLKKVTCTEGRDSRGGSKRSHLVPPCQVGLSISWGEFETFYKNKLRLAGDIVLPICSDK